MFFFKKKSKKNQTWVQPTEQSSPSRPTVLKFNSKEFIFVNWSYLSFPVKNRQIWSLKLEIGVNGNEIFCEFPCVEIKSKFQSELHAWGSVHWNVLSPEGAGIPMVKFDLKSTANDTLPLIWIVPDSERELSIRINLSSPPVVSQKKAGLLIVIKKIKYPISKKTNK